MGKKVGDKTAPMPQTIAAFMNELIMEQRNQINMQLEIINDLRQKIEAKRQRK